MKAIASVLALALLFSATPSLAEAVAEAGGAQARGSAEAGGSPKHRAIVLGRHNTILGRNSGAVDVVIPRRARIDVHLIPGRHEGPNPSIGLSGPGRSIGFVLAPAELPDDLMSGVVTAARFARCRSRGCSPRGRTVQFLWPRVIGSSDHFHKLQPGRYRLYLIADHAPVKVRFELKGLKGAKTIRMTDGSDIDVKSPRVRTELRGERTIYSAGAPIELRAKVSSFQPSGLMHDRSEVQRGACAATAFRRGPPASSLSDRDAPARPLCPCSVRAHWFTSRG